MAEGEGAAAGAEGSGEATGTQGAGTGGEATGGQMSFDWGSAGLDAESLNYVQGKGYQGPADVVKAYRSAESLLGVPAEQIIKLPQSDDAELWRPVYEKLGAGKTVDDYKLPIPEGDSGEFAKTAAGWFHEAGIPVKQANALAEKWNEHTAGLAKAQADAAAERDTAHAAQLKTEWGQNYDANVALVDQTKDEFGMSTEQLLALREAMGPADAMKFMLNVGVKLGVDDKFVSGGDGGTGFSGGSPEQARARLSEIRKDPGFVKRYTGGDISARQEMDRLHKIAYPGA